MGSIVLCPPYGSGLPLAGSASHPATALTPQEWLSSRCWSCGSPRDEVTVHGHRQCRFCGVVLERCCDL